MKTIYLRQKRSGNFEFSNKKDSTHKFNTKRTASEFYTKNCEGYSQKKVIKTYYRLSQIYIINFEDFWKKCKQLNK